MPSLPNLAGRRVMGIVDTIGFQRPFFVFTLSFVLILADLLPYATVSAAQDAGPGPAIRSCGHIDEEATASKVQKRKKNAPKSAQLPFIPSCLEIHALPLVVQEKLQQFVRQQNWAIFDEEINEVLWSFSLPLKKEELLAYGNPPAGTDRISWDRGRAVVLVRTISLSDGYSRTTIAAQLTGFGDSDDRFAMQRSFWEWSSNGRLEAKLAGELRTRFGAIQ